ncbi:hypothetical protein ACH4U3_37585 [Streptomyces griseoruber]|uniref:hypothetical protein n=1 Tax=Streptomyces griseoruber TaxID=1943 RepID=UPI0037AFD80A
MRDGPEWRFLAKTDLPGGRALQEAGGWRVVGGWRGRGSAASLTPIAVFENAPRPEYRGQRVVGLPVRRRPPAGTRTEARLKIATWIDYEHDYWAGFTEELAAQEGLHERSPSWGVPGLRPWL